MDILIKNMEMPKACGDCHFFKRGANPMGEDFIFAQPWGDCLVSGEENVIEHDISTDCPLVEVPPHGDLIERSSVYNVLDDRVALYKEVGDEYNACNIVFIEGDIATIPTVLEAST